MKVTRVKILRILYDVATLISPRKWSHHTRWAMLFVTSSPVHFSSGCMSDSDFWPELLTIITYVPQWVHKNKFPGKRACAGPLEYQKNYAPIQCVCFDPSSFFELPRSHCVKESDPRNSGLSQYPPVVWCTKQDNTSPRCCISLGSGSHSGKVKVCDRR